MTEQHFETHTPVELYVELGRGSLSASATETTESRVQITGRDADDVLVELDEGRLSIIAPKHRGGFQGGDSSLSVVVSVPTDSSLVTRLGSADLVARGSFGGARVKSGSGDVNVEAIAGAAFVETGSGDITVDDARGELRIKSGSGEVHLGHTGDGVVVSTGSGDVDVESSDGDVSVKTGSGNLRIGEARADVSIATGSGDLQVNRASTGRISAKGASGDIRVGIPAGVPVWTDLSTVSGRIHSTLQGAGEPAEGQDHVELSARTVSGDIVLAEV